MSRMRKEVTRFMMRKRFRHVERILENDMKVLVSLESYSCARLFDDDATALMETLGGNFGTPQIPFVKINQSGSSTKRVQRRDDTPQ